MQKIKKIIFDYGGVISLVSRKQVLIDKLSGTNSQYRDMLEKLFNSKIIVDFAKGEIKKEIFYAKITSIIGTTDVKYIDDIFKLSCLPDADMVQLLLKLKKHYQLFLISDSLPPFSEYIEKNFQSIFKKMYFSNIYKSRKAEDLFYHIFKENPSLFVNSLYIDDKDIYLELPRKLGAKCIRFYSMHQLIDDLKNYNIYV